MEDILKLLGVMSVMAFTGLAMYAGITAINAWQRRLSRREQPSLLDPDEVEALRAQAGEFEQLKMRLAETEERLDFAERMLAQGSGERAQLPGEQGR